MSNLDNWNLICSRLPSPQSYIDFGLYSMISAALQRRVWFYDPVMPVYPNQYIVFVGPPAIGKGLVLTKVEQLLRHHRYTRAGIVKTNTGDELPYLFPMGADSITFEQLLARLADSARKHILPAPENYYMHTSFGFILQELSSLFKQKTEDVVKFLIKAYDCDQYDYETKTQRKDRIRKLCLNFLAATQLDFLKDAHRSGIFGQGFGSRTTFIFETKRRFDSFHISYEITAEEKKAHDDLLAWLLQLSKLYGQISYSEETKQWLEDWYVNTHVAREEKAHEKLKDYLGRKKVILLKLAAAIHFSENLTMTIPLTTFQRSIELLDNVEKNMEAGLAITGKNELHVYARRMLNYIKERKEVPKQDIILGFAADLDVDKIELCIRELEIGYGLRTRVKEGRIWYLL